MNTAPLYNVVTSLNVVLLNLMSFLYFNIRGILNKF